MAGYLVSKSLVFLLVSYPLEVGMNENWSTSEKTECKQLQKI